MPEDKRLVYVLKSANPKDHYYIGLTSDVRARLADHNAAPGTFTSPSNFLTSNGRSISSAI